MAGLLVVRSRKVSAERQKGQVQGGSPHWRRGHRKRVTLDSISVPPYFPPCERKR